MSGEPLAALRFLLKLYVSEVTGRPNDYLVRELLPLLDAAHKHGYGVGYTDAESGAPRAFS